MYFLIALLSLNISTLQATIYTVIATTDAGTGAALSGDLRYCINTANGDATAGPHHINFAIPGPGPYSITLTSSYTLIRDMIIDATTQPGYNIAAPTPMVELKNSPAQAFVINSGVAATGSTIKGFIINGCSAQGILIQSPNNTIVGNYIGTNAAGTAAAPNQTSAILINGCCGFNTNGNIIGGTTTALRNVISGNNNAHGIECNTSSNNVIIGNYIGLNSAGTAKLSNAFHGIAVYGTVTNYKIGGLTPDSSNVISGNNQDGLSFDHVSNSRIVGNLIGTLANGTLDFGNSNHGIFITASSNILVFGNTVSGNDQIGINAVSNGTGIVLKKNYVGTSSNGLSAIGNSIHGIQVQGTTGGIIIGGNRVTEGNIISNSGVHGINLDPGSDGSIIKGNIIGSDINGTAFMGNGVIGVVAKSNNQIIGGTSNNEGNIIVDSKNAQVGCGLLLANANNALVSGNYIGVGLDLSAIPNYAEGINISVEDLGQTAANNIVQYNTIAYNLGHGINVGDALPIQELGAGGTVSNNDEYGNLIRRNSIYCNVYKGISLNMAGTAADRGNTGRAAPVVNTGTSTSTTVNGTSLPNDSIHIYVMSTCSNCNSNPQGKTFVAAVKANGAGVWTYTSGSAFGGNITATGTDASNNTSEFSSCLTLPVTFVSFSAKPIKNQETLLTWTTATELNNAKFVIEKSEDGIHFKDIGEVKGSGNSVSLESYTYTDNTVGSGIAYYRLRQVDYNGAYDYTNVISVQYDEALTLQLYPNPASSVVTVNIRGTKDEAYKLTLTDVLGRIVKEEIIDSTNATEINIASLSRGQYTVSVLALSGNSFYHEKLIIAK